MHKHYASHHQINSVGEEKVKPKRKNMIKQIYSFIQLISFLPIATENRQMVVFSSSPSLLVGSTYGLHTGIVCSSLPLRLHGSPYTVSEKKEKNSKQKNKINYYEMIETDATL